MTTEEVSEAYWRNRRKMDMIMNYWRTIGAAWEPARARAAMLSVLSIKRTL